MREVKLTDEQVDKLEQDWAEIRAVDKSVAAIMFNVVKRKAQLEHEFWKTIESIAGCNQVEGNLKFDPIARSIRVYETDSEMEE